MKGFIVQVFVFITITQCIFTDEDILNHFLSFLVSYEIAEGNGVNSVTGGSYREESRACWLKSVKEAVLIVQGRVLVKTANTSLVLWNYKACLIKCTL